MFYTYLDVPCVSPFVLGLCLLPFGVSYSISDVNVNIDKASGYECGFDPFSDARDPFNIKFYLVSILFIIFDVEMIFFFPRVLCQRYVLIVGFFSMYVSFIILVLGFFYEYRKKALDRSD